MVCGKEDAALSLAEILDARDRRAAAQARLAAQYRLPLASVTLVSPGPVKDSPRKRAVMDKVVSELLRSLRDAGLGVAASERVDLRTGPEALLVVRGRALDLKRVAAGLEEGAPWGRLADIDVFECAQGVAVPLRREDLGFSSRSCLVCGENAFECMRVRRHDAAAIAARVDELEREALAGGR
jgi:holo-ACP synthase